MENEITAHKDGKITKLVAKEGLAVNSGDLLATIE
jgi:biotin carboxyl carrier protein